MKFGWGQGLFDKPNKKVELADNYFEKIDDTENVWEIFNSILKSNLNHIELDFSKCNSISNTGLTILAALGPLCENKGRKISIEFGNKTELCKKLTKYVPTNNIKSNKLKDIPFKFLETEDVIPSILEDLNLIEEIASLDKILRDEISSRLYELCINACEHGKNEIGAVCNGTCNNQYFTFTVFDFGNGIKENVNTHLKQNLSTEEALKWAFTSSNSTLQSLEFPRGAGFTTIFKFVEKYHGQFILYTDNIYCSYKNNKYYFKKIKTPIIGTLITITINIS